MKKLNHLWHFLLQWKRAQLYICIYITIQLDLSFGGVKENFDVTEELLNMMPMTSTTAFWGLIKSFLFFWHTAWLAGS